MKEYQIMTGSRQHAMWNALIEDLAHPSDASKGKLKQISEDNQKYYKAEQEKEEIRFVSMYGADMLAFVKHITKDFSLLGKSLSDYSLHWDVRTDTENDNYWTIRFYKGRFDYTLEIAGGYGGREILESDISKERVKELLKLVL